MHFKNHKWVLLSYFPLATHEAWSTIDALLTDGYEGQGTATLTGSPSSGGRAEAMQPPPDPVHPSSPVSLSLPGGGLPLILGEWPSQPWRAGLPFFLCFPPRDMEPNVLWDQTVQPSPLSPSLQAATVLWQPTVPGAFL